MRCRRGPAGCTAAEGANSQGCQGRLYCYAAISLTGTALTAHVRPCQPGAVASAPWHGLAAEAAGMASAVQAAGKYPPSGQHPAVRAACGRSHGQCCHVIQEQL